MFPIPVYLFDVGPGLLFLHVHPFLEEGHPKGDGSDQTDTEHVGYPGQEEMPRVSVVDHTAILDLLAEGSLHESQVAISLMGEPIPQIRRLQKRLSDFFLPYSEAGRLGDYVFTADSLITQGFGNLSSQ
jgi:hypothetical protein